MKKLLFLVIVLFSSYNLSAQENSHGVNGDWEVFSTTQNGAKYCYTVTSSKKSSGTFKKRASPYLLVSYRPNNVSEVSISSGFPYKLKSTVAVVVDKNDKFDLFTSSETPDIAWAKDANDDRRIISSLRKGTGVKAKGYSKLGSFAIDEFSLNGFSKSYNEIVNLCSNTPASPTATPSTK
jgi:hypothetical protein